MASGALPLDRYTERRYANGRRALVGDHTALPDATGSVDERPWPVTLDRRRRPKRASRPLPVGCRTTARAAELRTKSPF
ncbi:hypothetical protein K933_16367 [Candidatus Halobonum tyrrellensis G22]|uniref:Uncharacterized protein n=1 Tax=Candidatus Halobonum tyrrellensis G22 TaxID=1324957 RepID=V4HGZ2_9EURY|nr:hypothetical protein K933_16367 [Candidatus Halobonum tyrrellensis G22]